MQSRFYNAHSVEHVLSVVCLKILNILNRAPTEQEGPKVILEPGAAEETSDWEQRRRPRKNNNPPRNAHNPGRNSPNLAGFPGESEEGEVNRELQPPPPPRRGPLVINLDDKNRFTEEVTI